MPVVRHTFKHVPLECGTCHVRTAPLLWSYDPLPTCACGGATAPVVDTRARAHTVIGDEIDRTLSDGLCYADGTPRRFTSRQELKAAERAAGVRIHERGERFRGDEAHKARAQARGY